MKACSFNYEVQAVKGLHVRCAWHLDWDNEKSASELPTGQYISPFTSFWNCSQDQSSLRANSSISLLCVHSTNLLAIFLGDYIPLQNMYVKPDNAKVPTTNLSQALTQWPPVPPLGPPPPSSAKSGSPSASTPSCTHSMPSPFLSSTCPPPLLLPSKSLP